MIRCLPAIDIHLEDEVTSISSTKSSDTTSLTEDDGIDQCPIVRPRSSSVSCADTNAPRVLETETAREPPILVTGRKQSTPKGLVHSALVTVQIIFGSASVIGALGLHGTHPLAFGLLRQTLSGTLLQMISLSLTKFSIPYPRCKADMCRVLILGVCMFGIQACNIVGLKLTDALTASIWMPTQPIVTTTLSMCRGLEPPNKMRIAGVFAAFLGCVAMVLLSSTSSDPRMSDERANFSADVANTVGNSLLFLNCISMAVYVILAKPLLNAYPPICLTAWSCNVSSGIMTVAALVSSFFPSATEFICPDCSPDTSVFGIPSHAYSALAYFVVFVSATNYFLITWSDQYATGTLVIGYSVLQPVTAALLMVILVGSGLYPDCSAFDGVENATQCLNIPSWDAVVGTMGIFCGLGLVVATEPQGPSYTYGSKNSDVSERHLTSIPYEPLMQSLREECLV